MRMIIVLGVWRITNGKGVVEEAIELVDIQQEEDRTLLGEEDEQPPTPSR